MAGPVRALAPPESAFARLGRSAREVRDQAPDGGYRAVLLDRPLLSSEITALAELARDESVLLMVRVVDPQVRGRRAGEDRTGGRAAGAGGAGRHRAVRAAATTPPTTPRWPRSWWATTAPARPTCWSRTPLWRRVERALADDDSQVLGELVDPGTLQVLRRWRPPRSERGLLVFFTGLSGSGKSTVARALVDRLHETDRSLTVLDGDVSRRMLSAGLGFSREDRDTNIRRLGWVGAEVVRHGGVAVLAPIAPFAATRAEVRRMVEANGDLVLVWVSTPLEECERRDRKGLYAKARRGDIPDFTGISSPYEQPDDADLVIDTTNVSVDDAVDQVWDFLVDGGWIRSAPGDAAGSAG